MPPPHSLAFEAPSLALLATEPLRAVLDFCAARVGSLAPVQGDGHPVIVYPGLGAGALTTGQLRSHLRLCNFRVHDCELGVNTGPDGEFDAWLPNLVERVRALHARYERRVSLVGWSLGGIYARQLAKRVPDKVRSVISLGSPFTGSPKATNAWKVYEFASGRRVDDRDHHIAGPVSDPPPVPTTSVFSRSDGICAWQTCLNEDGPLVENIEVYGSHCGLGHHPAAVYAVADRLAQPEGQWTKFDRSGWKSLVYPDWRRS